MTSDAGEREAGHPSPDLWHIPEILEMEIKRVHYPKPRIRAIGPKLAEASDAVEVLMRTSDEFPVRALSPALYIGGVPVTDSEQIEKDLYRFFIYDYDQLKSGAPINVGWTGFPEQAVRTKFRYEVRGK